MKLKDAEKRLKQEPNNLGLRVQVAGLMREAGRSLEAVELYRSVALAYRDQGRAQQAIAVCRSILEIAPEDAACQGLLAMLQQPGPPAAAAPPKPQPVSAVTMRGSPMPAAPDVPSLRPNTTPPTNQPAASPPAARPVTGPPATRPVTSPPPTQPVTGPPPTRPNPPTGGPRPIASAQPTRPVTSPPPTQRATTTSAGRTIARPGSRDSRASEPGRRSSLDETPLPAAIPYHLVDPTSQPNKISSGDIELPDDTRVEDRPRGLAESVRRISGLITDTRGIPREIDLAAELDTRQRPRIDPAELDKVAQPPSAVRDSIEDLDLVTPPPEDAITGRRDTVAPGPRGSDDELTPPPRPSNPAARTSHSSLPRIAPPRTSSRPPVVSIPPKTSSRSGGATVPPLPPPPPPAAQAPIPSPPPVTKLRAQPPREMGPLPRPGLAKIARDSEDEMTQPRERTDADDE